MASHKRPAFCDGEVGAGQTDLAEPLNNDDESTMGSQMSRRGVLGVLAAGAALAACSSEPDVSALVSDTSGTTQPLAGSQATSVGTTAQPVLLEVEVDAATRALNDSLATVAIEPLPAEALQSGVGGGLSLPSEIAPMDDLAMPITDGEPTDAGDGSVSMDDPMGAGGSPSAGDPMADPMADDMSASMADPMVDDMSPSMGDSMADDMSPSMGDSMADDTSMVMDDRPTVEVVVDEPAPAVTTTSPPAAVTAPVVTAAPTPLQPTGDGSLTAALVINKLTFGPKQGQVAQGEATGPGAFIDDQLRRTGPDPAVEKAAKAIKPIHYSPKGCVEAGLRNWWMGQYVTHVAQYRNARSEHQLFEMMCHLWMDHFSVFLSDNDAFFIPEYQEKVIRPNAMGTFKDLLKATAHSAAMLTYLDNVYNDASTTDGINENYGRELLELHTLGIDRNERQVYNEQDVRTVSTVMGGWSAGRNRRDLDSFGKFVYRPEREYGGADLSILNGAWSTAGLSGKQRGDSLLEFLATHPSTARNVSLRLCQRFVSDNPSQALVDSAADVFLSSDTSIVAVLRHIFTSDEFAASGGLKVRRPMEYEAALFRFVQTNIELVSYEGNDARSLRWYMKTGRGQEPWAWQQPDGYPDTADYWIKTDGFYRRWHDANYAARGARWGNNLSALLQTVGGRSAAGVVQEVAAQVGLGSLTADEVTTIAGAVGLDTESAEISVGGRQLQPLLALVMSHPRYQTR